MPPPRAPTTTTEEHRPPSSDTASAGQSVLLAAFPNQVAFPLPTSGEVVGRAWLANRDLCDTEVSGNHLRFFRRADGGAEIEDVGSRNGTWLDGARIPSKQRMPLKDGAVMRLGRSMFVYRAAFRGALSPARPLGKLVGPWGLCEVRARLAEVARSREQNVLLEGATGTGKELVAAAVIEALGRLKKPFDSINIAAVPAGVFEGQLFGWVRGAYSGSGQGGDGLLRKNDGGSIFLDEIGELPLDLQPKLLRVLENREVLPVGGIKTVPIDIAIIAATNRPLEAEVSRGAFRRDLFARFIERIRLPPLAARPEDVYAILVELARRRGCRLDSSAVEVEAVERLMLDSWPENVRGLDRVAAEIGTSGQLTLAMADKTLGAHRAISTLSREDAERMVFACNGNEREVERRYGVKRGKLRRALGKA